MIKDAIEQLLEYTKYIEQHYGLTVSYHDFFTLKKRYPILANVHASLYCMQIKSNPELMKRCLKNQYCVLKNCANKDIFFGMCYAGVEEFVIPLKVNNVPVGFISVSGYAINREKAMKKIHLLSKRYGLDEKLLTSNYNLLNNFMPDINNIKQPLLAAAKLFELIYFIEFGEASIPNVKTIDYIYEFILGFINNNYTHKITVPQLASLCHCSISLINHTFKKNSGMNINEYINSLRVKHAKRLINSGGTNINKIAFDSGFSDSSYFAKIFKEQYKISPSEYRDSLK